MEQVWPMDGAYDICFKLGSYWVLMLSMWIYATQKPECSSQACEFEIFTPKLEIWTRLHVEQFF